MTLLRARDLAIGYRGKPLAQGLNLAIEPASVTCLLGPNGVGKTTLFKSLLGMIPALGGEIELIGKPLNRMRRDEIARHIAYVPQAHAPEFSFSVLDLVVMGRTSHLGIFAQPGEADYRMAQDALAQLGIAELAEGDCARISGGQRQLAYVARALAQSAKIIVMDEPTASLDLANRSRVLEMVRRIARTGLSIIMATHEPEQAFDSADQVIVLERGGALTSGPPRDVLNEELLSRLYGVAISLETTRSGRVVVRPESVP
jgi:iron complex transport system ATP-binding protein